jgi:hypothetical protein
MDLLFLLARELIAIAPYALAILLGLILAFLLASIAVAIAMLFWWAGWTDQRVAQPAAMAQAATPAAAQHCVYMVYLSGIGHISSDYSTRYEDAFLAAIAAQVPDLAIVHDVFPFSAHNEGMTSERVLGRFWNWVNTQRLQKGRLRFTGYLILIRNILYTALSADRRYGPIYNYSVAALILQSLLRQGYRLGSGTPITLLGYSGGGQISLATAGYLKSTLRAPVQVISLGGVIDAHPAIQRVDAMHHLYGTRDGWQRFGQCIFPARWRAVAWSRWNRAVASGKITLMCLGPMVHTGHHSYMDDTVVLPSGRSYLAHTAEIIARLVREFSLERRPSILDRSANSAGGGP